MKTKFKIVLFLGLFLWGSCAGDQPQQEVVSMEDIMGVTGEEINESLDEVLLEEAIIPEGQLEQLIQTQQETFDTTLHKEFHPLDRFTFQQRQKITFRSKEGVTFDKDPIPIAEAEMFYYTFSDTLKTKNAFYNWLDCFGENCEMIKLNKEVDELEVSPLFSLVYDTTIVILKYRCEDQEYNWKPFQENLINKFGENFKHQIQVGCGGPLKWK